MASTAIDSCYPSLQTAPDVGEEDEKCITIVAYNNYSDEAYLSTESRENDEHDSSSDSLPSASSSSSSSSPMDVPSNFETARGEKNTEPDNLGGFATPPTVESRRATQVNVAGFEKDLDKENQSPKEHMNLTSMDDEDQTEQSSFSEGDLKYSFLENTGYFERNTRTKKIFVGGLSAPTTETDIRKFFSTFGEVTECTLMIDRQTHRHRGFAFVKFDSEEVVEKIVTDQFHEINGKMVEAKKAYPRETFFPKAALPHASNQPGVKSKTYTLSKPWKAVSVNPSSPSRRFSVSSTVFSRGLPFLPPQSVPNFFPSPYSPSSPPPPHFLNWLLGMPPMPMLYPNCAPALPYPSPAMPMAYQAQTNDSEGDGVPFTMINGTAYFHVQPS